MPYFGLQWNREPGTTELQTVPQNIINLSSLGFLNEKSEAEVEQNWVTGKSFIKDRSGGQWQIFWASLSQQEDWISMPGLEDGSSTNKMQATF